MKPILALAAALLLASPAPAATPAPAAIPSPYFIQLDLVEHVICGDRTGSGSRIDGDLVLTAEHVVEGGACFIDGAPAMVVYSDAATDMVVLRTPTSSPARMALACAPYVEGRTYFAVGYAFGTDFVVQRLTGSKTRLDGSRWKGQALLRGTIHRGMSGGPIVDESGAIVGVINAAPKDGKALAVSLPLTDTYLCRD